MLNNSEETTQIKLYKEIVLFFHNVFTNIVLISNSGHTFMPNNETFLPRYKMDTPHLVFPAVNAKESTYRTVLVQNEGTTPILYDMEKDESR